jgi:15-cis-phytoene synthase
MSAEAAGHSAAGYCASLVRASDFERYAATLFVSPEQRRALLALFAFNIEIARIREQISQPLAGEIRLQWWSDLLEGLAHGEAEANPVAAEVLRAIDRHALPLEILSGMIDAHRFDLYDEPMQTMEELEHYLVHTASALFSLGALVLGGEAGRLPVRDAGLAYSLARIIAALPAHASRGQMYLPLDELSRAGVAPEDVFAGRPSPELHRLLQELAGRARTHLQSARAQLAGSEGPVRILLPLALVDRKLKRLLSGGYKPFDPPQDPSNLATLWALWRASRSKPFS